MEDKLHEIRVFENFQEELFEISIKKTKSVRVISSYFPID